MSEEIQAKAPNIRLDNRGFVIPDNEHYPVIPDSALYAVLQ